LVGEDAESSSSRFTAHQNAQHTQIRECNRVGSKVSEQNAKKYAKEKEKTTDTKIHGHRLEVQSRIATIGEWQ
jgi:Fe2+ or Zn2+ uptake regulation protein